MTPDAEPTAGRKQLLRRELVALRRARSRPDRLAARTAIAGHLEPRLLRCTVICAYLPLVTEPLLPALLDRVHAAGVRVLVPVVSLDAPLEWTDYPTPTRNGPFGIHDPVGPQLGASAISWADVVLVPALAADVNGHRLGRGGGHYDRSLALLPDRDPGAPGRGACLIAVLFDGELLPQVPFERHDIAVDAIVTPSGGVQAVTR